MSDLATLGFKVNTGGLSRGERGLDSFARKGRKTEADISRSAKGITNSFNSIEISLGTLAQAFALIQGLNIGRDIVRMSDAWLGLNSQIRQVVDGEEAQYTAQKELIALSKATRSGLVETTKLYSELTRSTTELDLSQNRILGVTKTLNNLFMSGGRPISEVNGAIRQLSQGFAAGALRGDEFNSVAENAPRVLDALTQHLNMTKGELREFAATGGITAEIMVDALEKFSDQAQELADKTQQTFGQSMQIAETNVLQFIGNADALTEAISVLGIAIVDVTDAFAVFAASDQLDATLDLIGSKFDGFIEDLDTLEARMTKEPSFWNEFADNGEIAMSRLWQSTKNTFVNMPENIRTFIKVATVELASLVDIGTEYFILLGKAIGVQLGHLPTVAEANLTAFGLVLGTELSKYVTIAGAYGRELVDNLNPFDGDTFNLDGAIAAAEQTAQGMTEAYLTEADTLVAESAIIKDQLIQQAVEEANARIEVSREARLHALGDIMAEHDAAIAASDAQIEVIGEMGEAYRKLEKDRLAAVGEGAGTGVGGKKDPTAKQIKDLDKLIKQVDKFGGAWKRTGSAIIDAFGSIAAQMNDYVKRVDEINKNEKELAKQREIFGADNIDIIKTQTKLDQQRVEAELNNMRNLAGATASYFDEKTAAHRAFSALNQVLALAEISLSYQKMAASTAETTTHVANETTKQGSNALTAITSAFAAPFPVNFVAGAAMIGIMASLLGSSFRADGAVDPTEQRQDTQGTGSILGDSSAKSGSIGASADRFEDIQLDQLGELIGIRNSIRQLNAGIEQLARSVVSGLRFDGGQFDLGTSSSFGGGWLGGLASGLFGSTSRELLDSGITFFSQTLGQIFDSGQVRASLFADIETTTKRLFGLSSSSDTNRELQNIDSAITGQIADVFGFIGDTIVQSAQLLGFTTVQQTQSIFDNLANETFVDGDGTFGRMIRDLFTGAISPQDMQQALGQSVEVPIEEALRNFNIDIPEISLEGLNGEEIQQELEAIFSQQADLITEYLVPSITEFQRIGEGAFETLTRVAQEQAVFNDTIASLGMNLEHLSSLEQISIGQDLISLFGDLAEFQTATNSFFEDFFSEEEKLTLLEQSLNDVFNSFGIGMVNTKESFRDLVEGLDLTTEEGRALYAVLLEISPAMADYTEALRDNATTAFASLETAVDMQRQSARAVLDVATAQYNAEQERLNELQANLDNEKSIREEAISDAEKALRKSFDSEITAIKERAKEQKDELRDQSKIEIDLIKKNSQVRIDGLTNEKRALSATASALRSLVSNASAALGITTSAQLKTAFDAAQSGDFALAQGLNLRQLSNLDPNDFGSAEELNIQQARNRFRIGQIGNLAETEVSDTERMISSIDQQIEATRALSTSSIKTIRETTDEQIKAVDINANNQIEKLQEQLDTLLGLEDTTLSLEEAIKQYQEAQLSLDELNFDEETAKLDMLIQSNQEVYDLATQAYEDEIRRLDNLLATQRELLNAALGIDESVLSVEEAVNSLTDAITNLTATQEATTQTIIDTAAYSAQNAVPVQNTTSEPSLVAMQQQEMIGRMQEQNEVNQNMMLEIVRNTKTSAKALQQFQLDGIDTREIQ